jgi:hypothetical protein
MEAELAEFFVWLAAAVNAQDFGIPPHIVVANIL